MVNRRSGRDAERVDAAHIAQNSLSDARNSVVGDFVVMRAALAVAPGPSGRDSGVVKIGYLVVENFIVGAVSDPDADARRVDSSAARDPAVLDRDALGELLRVFLKRRFADLHPARAEVFERKALQRTVFAALSERDAPRADVAHRAAVERDIASIAYRNRRPELDFGLVGAVALRRAGPGGVREVDVFKYDVSRAFDPQKLGEPGRDDLRGADLLVEARDIG